MSCVLLLVVILWLLFHSWQGRGLRFKWNRVLKVSLEVLWSTRVDHDRIHWVTVWDIATGALFHNNIWSEYVAEARGGTVGWGTMLTRRKVRGSIPGVIRFFFDWHNPFGRTVALGWDSASNRNEYQEYFLGGVKGGRCVGLTTLPPLCVGFFFVLKSVYVTYKAEQNGLRFRLISYR
jgi:hypothetical protein